MTVSDLHLQFGWTNAPPVEEGIYLWSDGEDIGVLSVSDTEPMWLWGQGGSSPVYWREGYWRSHDPLTLPTP